MKQLSLIEVPRISDYRLICADLPADEVRQYKALNGGEYDADELAAVMYLMPGPKWTVAADGDIPIAAGGYTQELSGVWRSWMLARPICWEKYAEEVTNICVGVMEMMFADFKAHRLETVCLADRAKARRWYEKGLGLQYEGTRSAAGINKEDIAVYAKTRV